MTSEQLEWIRTRDDHAHKGADLAREILRELSLTNDEETDVICSAIYHRDDKYTGNGSGEYSYKANL